MESPLVVPSKRVVAFSDWHLPPERTAQTDFCVRFVEEVCAGAGQVFVLGDLFGMYVGPKHAGRSGHASVFEALGRLAAGGARVVLLRGNRDFLLDGAVARRHGMELVPGVWRGVLGGRAARLSHGDELSEDDHLHRVLRVVSAHFPVSTLVKSMPVSVGNRVAGAYRRAGDRRRMRRSERHIRPDDGRLRAEFARGTELVIIGHWHEPRVVTDAFGFPGKTLVMLGECTDRDACYAEVGGRGVELKHFAAESRQA